MTELRTKRRETLNVQNPIVDDIKKKWHGSTFIAWSLNQLHVTHFGILSLQK